MGTGLISTPFASPYRLSDHQTKFVDKASNDQALSPGNAALKAGWRDAPPRKHRKKVDESKWPHDRREYVDRIRYNARRRRERLDIGYVHLPEDSGDTRWIEEGLRTRSWPIPDRVNLMRVANSTPKAATAEKLRNGVAVLTVGDDKTAVYASTHKVDGLDAKYLVHEGPECEWTIRLDSDVTWASVDAMLEAIDRDIEDFKLPCRPHRIVWAKYPEDACPDPGQVYHPQFYWDLPYGQGVRKLSVGGRKRPVNLLNAIRTAVTFATSTSLGSDVGALANPNKGKNGLSPEMNLLADLNTTHWPTLSEWRCLPGLQFDLGARDRMFRWCADLTSFNAEESNAVWRLAARLCHETGMQAHASRAGWYVLHVVTDPDGAKFADRITDLVVPTVVEATGLPEDDVRKVVSGCARWVATTWSIERADGRDVQRGAAAHLVHGLTADEAHAQGGAFSRGRVFSKNDKAIADAIDRLAAEGRALTAANIAEASRVKLRTVYNHLKNSDDIRVSRVATQCKLKRDARGLPAIENSSLPSLPSSVIEPPEAVLTAEAPQDTSSASETVETSTQLEGDGEPGHAETLPVLTTGAPQDTSSASKYVETSTQSGGDGDPGQATTPAVTTAVWACRYTCEAPADSKQEDSPCPPSNGLTGTGNEAGSTPTRIVTGCASGAVQNSSSCSVPSPMPSPDSSLPASNVARFKRLSGRPSTIWSSRDSTAGSAHPCSPVWSTGTVESHVTRPP